MQKAVTVGNGKAGIRSHLKQLQLIADRPGNNGNRATATQGHRDSAAYVEKQLATTGGYWKVTEQPFVADIFEETAAPTLTPNPAPSPRLAGQRRLRDDGRLGQRGRAASRRSP